MLDSLNKIDNTIQRLTRWLPPIGQATITGDNLRDFVDGVNPRYRWYRHCQILADALERVANGSLRRLMVFMPPRHGKSELVSRIFPAYFLRRFPMRWVGLNSYGADLAFTLSRNARQNYVNAGGQVREDARAVRHWETIAGGGMWAAGVGGPITGKGGHLLIIDDPLKNAEEAASATIREKQKDWYRSTLTTREEPDGAIILIQTRWHEDDLAGWLLSQETDEDAEPEGWHIVDLQAISGEFQPKYPATCTIESDWRQTSQALCPERYDVDRLRKIRRRIGEYYWAALYGQSPGPADGDLFKRENLTQFWEVLPTTPWRIRYWDKAASAGKGAYTSGVRLSIDLEGRVCVEHVVRGQWGTADRRRIMLETARADRQLFRDQIVIFIEQEGGSSGVDVAYDETRLLAGFPVFPDRPSGDKTARVRPVAGQAAGDNVWLMRAPWNESYIEELIALPNGRYWDQADATAGAFNRLVEIVDATPAGTAVVEEPVAISPF